MPNSPTLSAITHLSPTSATFTLSTSYSMPPTVPLPATASAPSSLPASHALRLHASAVCNRPTANVIRRLASHQRLLLSMWSAVPLSLASDALPWCEDFLRCDCRD